jgi:hypothetical protein
VKKKNDYMKDLAIDPFSLEKEWLLQPQLYMKYSELAAEAQKKRDKAKERLDIVRAELDDKIRSSPLEYGAPEDKNGSPRITEAWISATILLQPEYSKAIAEINQTNYEYNLYSAAVRAFDHRKKALEMEVQLWSGGYWSAPNLPKEIMGGKDFLKENRDEVVAKQREGIQGISRRRRK